MDTFYLGVIVEALLALSVALIVQGVRRWRVERTWLLALAQQVAVEAAAAGRDDTTHSAL